MLLFSAWCKDMCPQFLDISHNTFAVRVVVAVVVFAHFGENQCSMALGDGSLDHDVPSRSHSVDGVNPSLLWAECSVVVLGVLVVDDRLPSCGCCWWFENSNFEFLSQTKFHRWSLLELGGCFLWAFALWLHGCEGLLNDVGLHVMTLILKWLLLLNLVLKLHDVDCEILFVIVVDLVVTIDHGGPSTFLWWGCCGCLADCTLLEFGACLDLWLVGNCDASRWRIGNSCCQPWSCFIGFVDHGTSWIQCGPSVHLWMTSHCTLQWCDGSLGPFNPLHSVHDGNHGEITDEPSEVSFRPAEQKQWVGLSNRECAITTKSKLDIWQEQGDSSGCTPGQQWKWRQIVDVCSLACLWGDTRHDVCSVSLFSCMWDLTFDHAFSGRPVTQVEALHGTLKVILGVKSDDLCDGFSFPHCLADLWELTKDKKTKLQEECLLMFTQVFKTCWKMRRFHKEQRSWWWWQHISGACHWMRGNHLLVESQKTWQRKKLNTCTCMPLAGLSSHFSNALMCGIALQLLGTVDSVVVFVAKCTAHSTDISFLDFSPRVMTKLGGSDGKIFFQDVSQVFLCQGMTWHLMSSQRASAAAAMWMWMVMKCVTSQNGDDWKGLSKFKQGRDNEADVVTNKGAISIKLIAENAMTKWSMWGKDTFTKGQRSQCLCSLTWSFTLTNVMLENDVKNDSCEKKRKCHNVHHIDTCIMPHLNWPSWPFSMLEEKKHFALNFDAHFPNIFVHAIFFHSIFQCKKHWSCGHFHQNPKLFQPCITSVKHVHAQKMTVHALPQTPSIVWNETVWQQWNLCDSELNMNVNECAWNIDLESAVRSDIVMWGLFPVESRLVPTSAPSDSSALTHLFFQVLASITESAAGVGQVSLQVPVQAQACLCLSSAWGSSMASSRRHFQVNSWLGSIGLQSSNSSVALQSSGLSWFEPQSCSSSRTKLQGLQDSIVGPREAGWCPLGCHNCFHDVLKEFQVVFFAITCLACKTNWSSIQTTLTCGHLQECVFSSSESSIKQFWVLKWQCTVPCLLNSLFLLGFVITVRQTCLCESIPVDTCEFLASEKWFLWLPLSLCFVVIWISTLSWEVQCVRFHVCWSKCRMCQWWCKWWHPLEPSPSSEHLSWLDKHCLWQWFGECVAQLLEVSTFSAVIPSGCRCDWNQWTFELQNLECGVSWPRSRLAKVKAPVLPHQTVVLNNVLHSLLSSNHFASASTRFFSGITSLIAVERVWHLLCITPTEIMDCGCELQITGHFFSGVLHPVPLQTLSGSALSSLPHIPRKSLSTKTSIAKWVTLMGFTMSPFLSVPFRCWPIHFRANVLHKQELSTLTDHKPQVWSGMVVCVPQHSNDTGTVKGTIRRVSFRVFAKHLAGRCSDWWWIVHLESLDDLFLTSPFCVSSIGPQCEPQEILMCHLLSQVPHHALFVQQWCHWRPVALLQAWCSNQQGSCTLPCLQQTDKGPHQLWEEIPTISRFSSWKVQKSLGLWHDSHNNFLRCKHVKAHWILLAFQQTHWLLTSLLWTPFCDWEVSPCQCTRMMQCSPLELMQRWVELLGVTLTLQWSCRPLAPKCQSGQCLSFVDHLDSTIGPSVSLQVCLRIIQSWRPIHLEVHSSKTPS